MQRVLLHDLNNKLWHIYLQNYKAQVNIEQHKKVIILKYDTKQQTKNFYIHKLKYQVSYFCYNEKKAKKKKTLTKYETAIFHFKIQIIFRQIIYRSNI